MIYDERTQPMSTTVLDHFRLDDKVAVVTGASSGLGVAFATALAEAGLMSCWPRDVPIALSRPVF